ncbi:hypothetical protein [Schleiferia thermophila]
MNNILWYFGLTIDELVNFAGTPPPDEVTIDDKSLMKQVQL